MYSFVDELNLNIIWNKFPVDYTSMHTDGESCSITDRFLVSNDGYDLCMAGFSRDSVDSISRHSDIHIEVDVESICVSDTKHVSRSPHPVFYKASKCDINKYRQCLEDGLRNISLSQHCVECDNLNSENDLHQSAIDNFFHQIMDEINNASRYIPKTCPPGQSKRIPGWNSHVKPFREEALLWKRIWEQQGKPYRTETWCHIGSHYCGILVYADGLMLLSPSVTGLQNMLDTCNQYSVRYGLKFNE